MGPLLTEARTAKLGCFVTAVRPAHNLANHALCSSSRLLADALVAKVGCVVAAHCATPGLVGLACHGTVVVIAARHTRRQKYAQRPQLPCLHAGFPSQRCCTFSNGGFLVFNISPFSPQFWRIP
ncbi:MAG: hypothetical protein FWC28_08760 [Proteobacteria bacterium]|nr:hypothetical protein [Cystobacterineae bacterium]MCL2259479.1 hypothetical protein [Cystobacterineae bacterium]MCL2315320.1 hypothetical protein [Pseudomonadota bacterium]